MRAKLFLCFNNNRIKGENYVPVKLEREVVSLFVFMVPCDCWCYMTLPHVADGGFFLSA